VTLLTLPAEGRYPPPLLLAALKSIDPRAELFHAGGGHWWLGVVIPNEHREQQGRVILKFEKERGNQANPRNILLGHLLVEGFARINGYEVAGDPSETVKAYDGYYCSILEDFRERDYWWNKDGGKQAVAAKLDESANGPAKRESEAAMLEYTITDGRAHYNREVKNRVQFGHGGMTGGTGRIITLN
jgi:hypothetical protein